MNQTFLTWLSSSCSLIAQKTSKKKAEILISNYQSTLTLKKKKTNHTFDWRRGIRKWGSEVASDVPLCDTTQH
jgi:hypothetical protein